MAVPADVVLRGVDEHLDEEAVERRGDRCDRLQGLGVAPLGYQLLEKPLRLEKIRGEGALGVLAVEAGRGLPRRLRAQDVANPLERENERAEVEPAPRIGQRGGALRRVREVPRSRGNDRRDLVVAGARALEVVPQPIREERLELRERGFRARPGSSAG